MFRVEKPGVPTGWPLLPSRAGLTGRKTPAGAGCKLARRCMNEEVRAVTTTWTKAVAVLLAMGFILHADAAPRVQDGKVLTREGLTLYTFDNDVAGAGRSVCNGACAGVFPPYLAGAQEVAKEPLSLLTREDGSKQWAHKGRPLYKFYADERPGDTGGDGMNRNLWHIARP
jgi:predicted lipoprotein with Yx(FWY)xxD motif